MPVKGLSQAEIDEATRAQVASGAKSTARVNRLPGETATEANARITAAYKEMTAKPIISKEAKDAGVQVKFVRTEAGGVGEYQVIKPIGYTGPDVSKTTKFTPGVIPANVKRITGTSVGFNPDDYKTAEDMQRIAAKLGRGEKLSLDEQAFMDRGLTTPAAAGATKTVSSEVKNADGSTTVTYSDGTSKTIAAPVIPSKAKKVVDAATKNADGTTTVTYSDGTSEVLPLGTPVPTPNTAIPGPTGTSTVSERMLASDTFANTFALAFGSKEASQPYVKILYDLVSGFYKSGSDIEESLNLAIRQARDEKKIPEFTKRFKGIFALEDRLRAGEAVTVPTVAQYIQSEAKVGELLTEAGMADLATQDFIGEAFAKGKSVAEITRILSGAFNTIDNAPAYLKAELSAKFPTVTRSGLAKALIAGDIGAQALEKEIRNVSVISAGKYQGVTPSAKTAENLANLGYDFASSLSGFGQVAQATPTMQKLQEISRGTAANTINVQEGLTSAIFEKNIQEQEKMRIEAEKEAARFGAKSGTIGSKSLASQSRGNRLI